MASKCKYHDMSLKFNSSESLVSAHEKIIRIDRGEAACLDIHFGSVHYEECGDSSQLNGTHVLIKKALHHRRSACLCLKRAELNGNVNRIPWMHSLCGPNRDFLFFPLPSV